MSPEQQLKDLVRDLEAQRSRLGDAVVDAALAPLRARLAALASDAADAPAPEPQSLRQVTIVFMDVVDSTLLSQHLDPEDTQAVMDGLLAPCSDIVRAHGGKVLQYAGDSLLAAFGAEESREDDPERALRAGLALLDEASRQARAVQRRHGFDGFNVRVGAHTGPVLLGGGVDAEGTIRGLAVSIAARMEQTAPAGALRISRDTHRHVRGVFDMEPQPPLAVKGLDQPVLSYLVRRAKPRAFRDMRRGIEGLDTPLVGRDAETAALTAAFESVAEGSRSALVTVLAEAGLGKSRLIAEFEQWMDLRPERIVIFRGRAHPLSPTQHHGVLRDLLYWRHEIHDSDTLAQARDKLIRGLAPVFGPRAEEQSALLGHLIGLDQGDSAHIAGIGADGRQLRIRAFNAGVAYFRGLCAGGEPVVVLLDDLQWADDGSLDFFEQLGRAVADLPVLILCGARPGLIERRAGWGADVPNARRLELRPLGDSARLRLADALLERIEAPPPVLHELLTAGGDGNPFYMEELTAMLIDEGAIATSGSRWEVVPDRLLGPRVPTTLTGVLQARIDTLPLDERLALQEASVIGALFWDEALAQIRPDSPQRLPSLRRRQFVLGHDTSAFESTREFAFRHHLLHQVTYEGVLKRHKREQHRLVAAWLEKRCAGRSSEYLALLAEHFERAGLRERATAYWTQAATAAGARNADALALTLTDRGLAVDDGSDPASRFLLLEVREGVFARRSARHEQEQTIAELEQLAERLGDDGRRALAAQRRAWFLFASGAGVETAITAARRALALAGTASTAAAARAHNALLATLARLGRFDEARDAGRAGLEIARACGDRVVQAHLLNNLASVAMDAGDLAEAESLYAQAIDHFNASGHRWGEAGARGNLANLSMTTGRAELARDQLADNLRLCAEVGNRSSAVHCLFAQSQVLLALGEPAAALESAAEAGRIAREIGDRHIEAQALSTGGQAWAALGRPDVARRQFGESRDAFDAMRLPHAALQPLAGLARLARSDGDAAAARSLVDEILARAAAGPVGNVDFSVRLTCWEVLSDAGDPRAGPLLEDAHRELMQTADRITDASTRSSFLERVAAHAQIAAAWRSLERPATR
jgi:predicted ATPase/class 3 adenylate cyclase